MIVGSAVEHLERLILDLKESLEREFEGIRADLRAALDRQEIASTRLDRHAASIQTGRRFFARQQDWADRTDANLDRLAKRLDAVEKQLRRQDSEPSQ